MLKNIKTIYFDFDGTLHDSIRIYKPAFLKAFAYLASNHKTEPRSWNEDEISHWLGFNSIDMWKSFMPDLDSNTTTIASKMIGDEMVHQLKSGNGILYNGTIEILKYLKNKGYTLVFLSNCGETYKNVVNEKFHLDHYFDALICSAEYNQIPKYEILRQIKSDYQGDMIIIGDRYHDIEAGCLNHIYTIGCEYGYGKKEELLNADFLVQDITQLTTLL